ncbi:unnamed protein product [Thlaspi arvense]|uniref:Transcription initiation factor IIE subunit beta n=1 Tax=Thlaspi arvense TaxID=13288 RepID=A0AAU9SUX6_THLAR|nr:unnamed protein product [Thlaspi arvense]
MSLRGQLDKFKKQQEKCQSTLSSINASRPVAGPSRHPVPAAVTQKPTASGKLFSKDTDRLQAIHNIRKAPTGSQIKRVIEILYKERKAFTPEQINEECYVDMLSNKAVFDSMKNNPKVHYDGRRFSYKSTHDVTNKDELLALINKYPTGIAAADLKDAYKTVMDDLQALKASKHIWFLSNADSQEDIAYPNDFKGQIDVDDEFKSLFREIKIPTDLLDVENELQKIGLKPVMNTAQKRAAAEFHGISNKPKQKKKKQEISKRTKLTNSHLPELFQNLNAGSSSRN